MKTHLVPFASLVVVSALGACGGETPAPALPRPVASVTAPPPSASASAAPEAPATSDPTALTEAQRARDKALAPKVEAILDAYGNFDPQLSGDGKKLLFRSNRGGLPEAYLADPTKPGEAPKKIVGGPERVQNITFTRDMKYVLFAKDEGADENFRIFRASLDGGDVTNLTPGEKTHRDPPILPKNKPGTMFYSSRKTSTPESPIWMQSIAGGEPKLVVTDPGPSFVVDASPDGARLLFVRIGSMSEQMVFEVDVASAKTKRVYPGEGKRAGISYVVYSHDAKRILVATDEGAEGSSLLALDATTLAVKATYKQTDPPTASIDGVEASPRGDRLAILLNAGNHKEVRMLDAKTLAPKGAIKAPLGTLFLGPFTDDGRTFTVAQSVPDAPTDVFAVDAATGAMKPLRDDKRAGLGDMPPISATIESVKSFDGTPIPVNVYLPRGLDASKKLPTIVSFHGGPASSSSIAWNYSARFFTSQGFAFIEPNIRGSSGFGRAYEMADDREKRADALKDVEAVNRWARAQAWCDGDRVVIHGGSYGGYLVLMALTRQPALWRAGIDLVGISDLKTFLKATDQSIRKVFVDEFGDLEKDAALLDEYSPIRDVAKIVSPLFVYQGQNDPRVPRPESDTIVRVMRTRKIPVEYMVAANEGHSMDRRENRVAFMTRVVRFLRDEMHVQ